MAVCVAKAIIGEGIFHHDIRKSKRPKPAHLVRWEAPVSGTIKINVDGSSFGNPGRAGIGGLIRDTNGKWIAGFTGSIGISKILYAELSAIKNGLELAWNKGFRKIICETDSKDALQEVKFANINGHKHGVIIGEIRRLLERKWEVNLVHVFREGNQCADYLAKLGTRSKDGFHTWNFPLPELQLQLVNDATGVTYCRSHCNKNILMNK